MNTVLLLARRQPSCNCVVDVIQYLLIHVLLNVFVLKLTVYCVCEAAKPNSQCLLYCNNSSNQISVKFPFQWYQYHIFRENQVGLVKLDGDSNSHVMTLVLAALIAKFSSPTPQ